MQKFRDYIYVNSEKINLYTDQIPEFREIETSTISEKDTKVGGGISVGFGKANAGLSEKKVVNYTTSVSDLERLITWALNNNAIYFNNDTALENSDKDKLIIIEGIMNMPEMIENFEMIQSLKEGPLSSLIPVGDNDDSQKILSIMNSKNNIPILLDADADYIISCSIERSLTRNMTDFLDNLGSSITIIGKIERVYNENRKIEIYDIGKEILNLNRTIRRNMPEEDLEKMIISVDGPLIKIIPIIIYK